MMEFFPHTVQHSRRNPLLPKFVSAPCFFYFYSQEGKSQVLFLKTKYLFKELNNKQQQQKIHMFSFYSAFGNSVSSLEGAGYL